VETSFFLTARPQTKVKPRYVLRAIMWKWW